MAKQIWRKVLCAAVLAFPCSASWAQAYLGVGLGANFYRDAEFFAIEDESTAFEVKGGVHLIEVLGLEASYLNLGQFRDLENDMDVGFSGVTVSGKAILPLGPQMDIYGKIGMYFWELDEKYRGESIFLDEGEDLIFGGGVAFKPTDQISLDFEYRSLQMVDLEADLFSAGITLYF